MGKVNFVESENILTTSQLAEHLAMVLESVNTNAPYRYASTVDDTVYLALCDGYDCILINLSELTHVCCINMDSINDAGEWLESGARATNKGVIEQRIYEDTGAKTWRPVDLVGCDLRYL